MWLDVFCLYVCKTIKNEMPPGGLLTPLVPAPTSALPELVAEYEPWVLESGNSTAVSLLDHSVELASVMSMFVLSLRVATAWNWMKQPCGTAAAVKLGQGVGVSVGRGLGLALEDGLGVGMGDAGGPGHIEIDSMNGPGGAGVANESPPLPSPPQLNSIAAATKVSSGNRNNQPRPEFIKCPAITFYNQSETSQK